MPVELQGEGVSKTFKLAGRTGRALEFYAVRDVRFRATDSSALGIVGESGCGKSTLARLLVGLESPTSGTVTLGGKAVVSKADWSALRRSVQYVFQDPYSSLPPRMKVREIVRDPLRIEGLLSAREQVDRVDELLAQVGIAKSDSGKYPREFSGGQRQRVGIARALVLGPQILICDEVTSGLDVSIQAQILNLLVTLRETMGLGLVFISHDLRVVRHLCDTVAVMYRGRVIEEGPAAEVMSDPRHPYSDGLLTAIADHQRPNGSGPMARIPGDPPSAAEQISGCPFWPRCHKARDRCRNEVPQETSEAGRSYRCHFPVHRSTRRTDGERSQVQ